MSSHKRVNVADGIPSNNATTVGTAVRLLKSCTIHHKHFFWKFKPAGFCSPEWTT